MKGIEESVREGKFPLLEHKRHIDDPHKIIVTVTYVTATREFAHNYKLYYYTAAKLSFYQLLLC